MSDYDELASALALLILFVGPLTVAAALAEFLTFITGKDEQ